MWFHYLPVPDLIRGVQCSESSDVVHTSSSWDFRCSGVASHILIIGWAENDEQFTKKYEKDWTFSDVSGQRMHPLQQVTSYKKGQNIWQLLTFKMTRGWWPLLHCCFTSTETIRTIGDGEPRMATLIFTQLLSSDIPKILHIALVRIRSRRRDDKSPTLVVLTRIRRDCGSHSLGGGGAARTAQVPLPSPHPHPLLHPESMSDHRLAETGWLVWGWRWVAAYVGCWTPLWAGQPGWGRRWCWVWLLAAVGTWLRRKCGAVCAPPGGSAGGPLFHSPIHVSKLTLSLLATVYGKKQ